MQFSLYYAFVIIIDYLTELNFVKLQSELFVYIWNSWLYKVLQVEYGKWLSLNATFRWYYTSLSTERAMFFIGRNSLDRKIPEPWLLHVTASLSIDERNSVEKMCFTGFAQKHTGTSA